MASLHASGFQVLPCRSISDLENLCGEDDLGVVILDLDNPLVNNRVLRDLKQKRPAMQLIGISSRVFHPELKDAISKYMYACLCEPLDPEELIYLVKSIFCNATNSKESPVENELEDHSFTGDSNHQRGEHKEKHR
jgi:DNA-binding NtrC family response regulator